MRLPTGFAILGLFATQGAAAPAVMPTFLLSMHFDDGSGHQGDPRVQVRAGEPATVAVKDGASGRRVTMQVTVAARADGLLNVRSEIEMVAADGTRRRATPSLLVRPNETTAIDLAALSASAQPVRVTFNVRPL